MKLRQRAPVLPHWPPLERNITDTRGVLNDDYLRSNIFGNRTPALNPDPLFRFREIKYKQEPQAEIFTFANPREHLGLTSFSFPGTGGSADATQDLASESPNRPPDSPQANMRSNLDLERKPPQLQP